jgi:hypothetical protein
MLAAEPPRAAPHTTLAVGAAINTPSSANEQADFICGFAPLQIRDRH